MYLHILISSQLQLQTCFLPLNGSFSCCSICIFCLRINMIKYLEEKKNFNTNQTTLKSFLTEISFKLQRVYWKKKNKKLHTGYIKHVH